MLKYTQGKVFCFCCGGFFFFFLICCFDWPVLEEILVSTLLGKFQWARRFRNKWRTHEEKRGNKSRPPRALLAVQAFPVLLAPSLPFPTPLTSLWVSLLTLTFFVYKTKYLTSVRYMLYKGRSASRSQKLVHNQGRYARND